MGTTEGVSLGATATAAVAGAVYFAKNGEFPSSGKSGNSAQGIAERIASISDEEIAKVFGEKVDEIEAAVKEVASGGYNYIVHHKHLAVVVVVLSVVFGLIILALRRYKSKDTASAVENGTSDAADAALTSTLMPSTRSGYALSTFATAGKDYASPSVAATTGGEARPKTRFRSPVKRVKIISPVRRSKKE